MKRLILSLFFVTLFVSLAFSGNPLLLKGITTSLGMGNARSFGIYEKNSYILTYGYVSSLSNPYVQFGFLACFDSSLGLKWEYKDSSSSRPYISRALFLSNGNVLAELRDGNQNNTSLLFIDGTGTFLKKISMSGNVSIGNNGNGVIAVTAGSNGTVYFMDESGTIVSQWNTSYTNGNKVKISVRGASLWLTSFTNAGAYTAKHNLLTGTLLWRRINPNGFLGYSDVDSVENTYFGSTQLVLNPGAPGFTYANQWHLEKIDSSGNVTWITEWYSRPTWVGRVNAAITTIAIYPSKNLVVVGGEMQKEETVANGDRINYLAGFSMDSGKVSWEKKWGYSSASVSTVYGVCFNEKGNMLVTGYEYGGNFGNLHLEKYAVDNVTGVKEITLPTVPKVFALSQNYPNPFNPSTVIHYAVPHTSEVSLIVYDALGREVETLVRERKNAGEYEVRFTASSLPSGIYFYRLQTADRTETKKMILLK
ncbi:MAG: T9SS type A sorting domain-containing protein [Candidatus Paceibacterota bacterium]|jgi:hypothetical protein